MIIKYLKDFEKQIFSNYPGIDKLIVDIILLKGDLKKVIQYPVSEFNELEFTALTNYLQKNNLTITKFQETTNKAKILIQKNKDKKDYLKILANTDDESRGKLFGYPNCCIKNLKNLPKQDHIYSNDNLDFILNQNCDKLIPTNNFLLFDSNFRLFSHLPCSKNCKKTQENSEFVLNELKENYPDLVKYFILINSAKFKVTQNHILFKISDKDKYNGELLLSKKITEYDKNNG